MLTADLPSKAALLIPYNYVQRLLPSHLSTSIQPRPAAKAADNTSTRRSLSRPNIFILPTSCSPLKKNNKLSLNLSHREKSVYRM